MKDLEIEAAFAGIETREFKGKSNFRELTDSEREEFVEKRIEAIEESDLPEAAKQAALMRGAMSGLSTATAFERYVMREEYWFR